MKKNYLSIGVVILEKQIKGQGFIEIDDKNNLNRENTIFVKSKKHTALPIGWIIEIEIDGSKLKGFNFVRSIDDRDFLKDFYLQDAEYRAKLSYEKSRKRALNEQSKIENMTMKEIKEKSKIDPFFREVMIYYILRLLR